MAQGINWRTLPKITWGTSYAATLELGRPMQEIKAYSEMSPGFEQQPLRGGSVDAWVMGLDQLLEAKVVAIPTENEVTEYGVTATGWAGDTGWEGFLEWAYQRYALRFFPDRTSGTYIPCYLETPWRDAPAAGWYLHRDQQLKLRSTDGTPFTGY